MKLALGAAALVAGGLALTGAGAAIARTPEGFLEPSLVFVIFSTQFFGFLAVAAPLGLLCAAVLRLTSRSAASAERALPAVVAALLAAAAILDQVFALDAKTLEPAGFGWGAALLGALAAISAGALLARALRGSRGAWLARGAGLFLVLGVVGLALLARLRGRLPAADSPGLLIVALAPAVAVASAALAVPLAQLGSGARRGFWLVLAAIFGAILTAPLWPEQDRRAAASPTAVPTAAGASRGFRNVLLISIDTLRADRLSCYGNPRRTSPAIDALAAEGVRFEQAFSTSSWTLPSHASMLTGLHPASHGADRARNQSEARKIDPLSPTVPTLAEEMRRRGYRTAAFVSNVFTSSAFGLERGFDEFHDRLDRGDRLRTLQGSLFWRAMLRVGFWSPRDFDAERHVEEILPEQIRWIERHAGEPFFLFLHYMEPHYLYEPPEPHRRRADGSAIPVFRDLDGLMSGRSELPGQRLAELFALYDGEIAWLDAHLAELFAALDRAGLREKTLVIVTADHGESLGEHGLWSHGEALVEEQIRVPLILRLPGVIPAGVIVKSGLASHVDLAPTILDVLRATDGAASSDATEQPAFQGASLRPLWEGGSGGTHQAVYAEIRSDLTWRRLNPALGGAASMVRTASAKFVLEEPDRRSLFLLREDPGEQRNVAGRHPELVREMELALRAWKERTPQAGEAAASPLDAGTVEQLRKLGYLR